MAIPFASIPFPKLHLPLFEDDRFTATKFNTSADKAKFANQLLRFIAKGFPEASFNRSFYTRLSMCFSHIAHYDRHGFWDHFFTSTEGRIDFIDHTLRGGGYGDPAWTHCDVELAVRKRVREAGVMEAYRQARTAEITGAERELLRRLKAQYEPEPEPGLASEPVVADAPRPARPVPPSRPAMQLGLF